jgi:hypothetical protein
MERILSEALGITPEALVIADWQLPISNWCWTIGPSGSRQLKIGNGEPMRYPDYSGY